MKKLKIFLLTIFTIIIVSISTLSFADVGSFDRYDSGSDWGWDSSSSSSDWDWDSSSSSSDWDWDSNSDLGDLLPVFLINLLFSGIGGSSKFIFLIVIIVIIVSVRNKKKQTTNTQNYKVQSRPIPSSYNTNNPHVDLSQSHIIADKIKQIDPNFSEEKILSWAKDLYVKMQNAWTAREWEIMRPLETENLFEQHRAQLQNYIDTNRINVVDRIAVNFASIYGFRQEGDRDILEVALKATKKDYIIDATTKEVLEGDKNQDRITTYKLTFERKTGVLTPEGTEEIKKTNCPNCGAPTEITSAGKCKYCGSVITTGSNTWVLSGLEPLRN